jgi:hypothetical protein
VLLCVVQSLVMSGEVLLCVVQSLVRPSAARRGHIHAQHPQTQPIPSINFPTKKAGTDNTCTPAQSFLRDYSSTQQQRERACSIGPTVFGLR